MDFITSNAIGKIEVYKFKCSDRNADNVNDYHWSLDVSTVNRLSYSEEETFIDRKYNPSYDDLDTQALENPEERLLRLGTLSDHVYSEYDKDNIDQSVDKEFEDFLCSNGVNPDTYVLSSGRWDVNQGMH